jgi:hypothetical protein
MTQSKGIGRGGHREGAGRPAIDKGKTATFATRVTQRTRDLLDAEARREGNSVAAVAERLLRTALEKKIVDSYRSKEERQLFALIDTLLIYIPKPRHWNDPEYQWHSNAYLFEAFRLAIGYLMMAMRPPGEIVPPPPEPKSENYRKGPDNPLTAHADFLEDMIRNETKYPESVDEFAREVARSVIYRARQKIREDERPNRGPQTFTAGGEKHFLSADDDDDIEFGGDHIVADAARALLDRGKK